MYQYHFHFTTARVKNIDSGRSVRLSNRHITTLTLLILMVVSTTPAAMAEEFIVRSMSEVESGSLLFVSDNRSHYIRAPLLETSVNIGVQGLLARTVVEQQFTNDSSEWVEGIYAFPLPDNATVDELTMIIGDSKVEGEIQTRKKARTTYETAKAHGKKASLLEQQRPNLFTTRVANIPPGESLTIRIGFQSAVRYTDGQFSLSFPLTITPRYLPTAAESYDARQLSASTNSGWTTLDQLEDAANITPPMSSIAAPGSITVTLDSGLSGLTIDSTSHDIITHQSDNSEKEIWNVSLASQTIPADRDFKLSWYPHSSGAPVAAVFRQDSTKNGYPESFASVMVMPPQEIFSDAIPAREVIFVIDTSQSMGGNSIRQARQMLTLAIARLPATDFFTVIEFNSNTRKLFNRAVPANEENKDQAINWVANLKANGGTEILGALKAALHNQPSDERLQQLIFITDGSVGNEDEIFKYLSNNIGTSRLFTVAIGSAPNTWFMRKSAELGRGTYTSIANTAELADKALTLLAKLEQPAITDIALRFNTENPPEVYPVIMPDVYMGDPIQADARWTENITTGDIEITGTFAGQTWTQNIKLGTLSNKTTEANNQQGLDKLWAGRKIQAIEDSLLFSNNIDQVESAITEVALDYSMVTKYTSLVAVEDAISRDTASKPLQTSAIPQATPAGAAMHYPQGSLGTTLRLLFALLFALLALLLILTRRQVDTSVVCTPLKSEPQKC